MFPPHMSQISTPPRHERPSVSVSAAARDAGKAAQIWLILRWNRAIPVLLFQDVCNFFGRVAVAPRPAAGAPQGFSEHPVEPERSRKSPPPTLCQGCPQDGRFEPSVESGPRSTQSTMPTVFCSRMTASAATLPPESRDSGAPTARRRRSGRGRPILPAALDAS